MTTALALMAALAIALAWPLPNALARAAWPAHSPRIALVLWQAIAIGGALATLGVLLGITLAPIAEPGIAGLASVLAHPLSATLPQEWSLLSALALSAALLFGGLLLANLMHVAWVTERARRRHLARVAVLTEPLADSGGVRLLDHPTPLAFCVPGAREVTVVTSGMVELFTERERQAVIAHERAHLRGGHHAVLFAFRAWHAALPWFPVASRAELAIASLLELIADDAAVEAVDRRTLASAIARVDGSWDEGLAIGQSDKFTLDHAQLGVRLARLEASAPRPQARVTVAAIVCSISIVVAPAIVLAAVLIAG